MTIREHWIRCRRCRRRFDLLRSEACACPTEIRTRKCAHCDSCLCREPIARDPDWWVDVPRPLRALGVDKIPVDYL